ncbi:MAG: N-acylglucosamine-6-phosphate 2-epimerase [Erysipelotrichia bacterium]|nr:N-acylglucosamine-6-phosphate 2-epimerase [Erysipelotrichia bacterium]
MKEIVKKCLGELVVSCQAYPGTPFYGPENVKKFVECALWAKAKAVRCCWPQDIAAARSLDKDLIIIGITKAMGNDSEPDMNDIFITPTLEAAASCVEAGANIVAFDSRITAKRGKEELLKLWKDFSEKYPDVGIMADCATFEECLFADQSGYVDIVANTLSGLVNPGMTGPDLDTIRKLKKVCRNPINGEGRIWDLRDLEAMNDAGADMITIGTAITRPQLVAQRFINHYNEIKKK